MFSCSPPPLPISNDFLPRTGNRSVIPPPQECFPWGIVPPWAVSLVALVSVTERTVLFADRLAVLYAALESARFLAAVKLVNHPRTSVSFRHTNQGSIYESATGCVAGRRYIRLSQSQQIKAPTQQFHCSPFRTSVHSFLRIHISPTPRASSCLDPAPTSYATALF